RAESRAQFHAAIGLFGATLTGTSDAPDITIELIGILADCPEVGCRDPARAVVLAERAVSRDPRSGGLWSYLALARYRIGEWEAALRALKEAMNLRAGGTATEWFLMALVCGQQGRRQEARSWEGRAVDWMVRNRPGDVVP